MVCFCLDPSPMLRRLLKCLSLDLLNVLFFIILQSTADAIPLGATNYLDYTSQVEAIKNNVRTITEITDCCAYENQMLDQYCVSRTPVSSSLHVALYAQYAAIVNIILHTLLAFFHCRKNSMLSEIVRT